MELFFAPFACSMASRIALYQAGAEARFIEVDTTLKKTMDGADYRAIHALGVVPALRRNDGEILTENAAILQYLVDLYPAAELGPREGLPRLRLQQWLSFIGTELHKGIFMPLLDRTLPEDFRSIILSKGRSRMVYLDRYLADRAHVLDRFSVADAYLVTVLNWRDAARVDLAPWPAVQRYYERTKQHPSVARAMADEMALYVAREKRVKAN